PWPGYADARGIGQGGESPERTRIPSPGSTPLPAPCHHASAGRALPIRCGPVLSLTSHLRPPAPPRNRSGTLKPQPIRSRGIAVYSLKAPFPRFPLPGRAPSVFGSRAIGPAVGPGNQRRFIMTDTQPTTTKKRPDYVAHAVVPGSTDTPTR